MVDPNIQFYMKVPLGDGSYTNGRIDYTGHADMLGISSVDLRGQRVLDIAANDGFWSFWAERRGADVLAIDVDGFDGYDWGFGGPPDEVRSRISNNEYSQWRDAGAGFKALHDHFRSNVERRTLSIYDLDPSQHGEFDLVFNYGLLYHLRHPLLSLDTVRKVCRGAMILETHIVNDRSSVALSVFYHDDVFRGWTNWAGPTEASIAAWLRSAGFPYIKTRRPDQSRPNGRQVFAASTTREWADRFTGPQLVELDDTYFDEMRRATRRFVEGND